MTSSDRESSLIIVGAGRQGRNIRDICDILGVRVAGFLDDTKARGEIVDGAPVLGGFERAGDAELSQQAKWIVGVGDNSIRQQLSTDIQARGGRLASVIHPNCAISPSASLGEGVYINAYARVLANASVADYALIEGLSTVGADCVLGEAVLIAPGCQLTAGCRIGARAFLGAGAVVVGPASVGADSIIGAGATVIESIPEGMLAMGTPARIKKPNRPG